MRFADKDVALLPGVGNEAPARIAPVLDALLDTLSGAWPPNSSLVRRASDLARRLRDSRLQLAVLGQFKRGKSTFLNALLGESLLPTGVVPLTAIPTFIAWGPTPLVRVTYRTGRPTEDFDGVTPDDIRRTVFRFVAEEANPRNQLGVDRVDLMYPAFILKNNVVLVDTPGIGSTHRHNTDAALQVLPECDAAIFVVSADPPITEAELTYLGSIRPTVARIFFILNKADYLPPDDLETAAGFLRATLQQSQQGREPPVIFCLSALRGLKAKQTGDVEALFESGLGAVEARILRYLAQEKLGSLANAVTRKANELVNQAQGDLALKIRALEMPLEDLEQRRNTLEESFGRITREARVMRDLLAGDRRRAIERLEQQAADLRQTATRQLDDIVDNMIAIDRDNEGAARQAIAAAIPDLFQCELGRVSAELSRAVEEILESHQRRIDDLVDRVRRTAADLFEVPHVAVSATERFNLRKEPYWVMEQWGDRLVVVPARALNRMLPAKARLALLRRRLHEEAAELVQRNVENLRWAALQGLEDTFRRFAASLDDRLTEAVDATRGAIAAAADKRIDASYRAEAELDQLKRTLDRLTALHGAFDLTGPSEAT